MSRSDIEAGKAHITLYANSNPLIRGLNQASAQLKGLGSSVMGIGAALTGLGAGLVSPLVAAVAQFSALGSELADVSARTGVAGSKLAELKFAAEQTGASLAHVEAALRNMARKGFSAGDFDAIAASIAAISDPSERAAQAMEVFGKSGTMLLPMFASLAELRREAQANGLIPTDSAIAAADALGDAWDAVKSVVNSVIFEVGAALAPVLTPALAVVKAIGIAARKWVKENQQIVRTVAMIGGALVVAGGIIATIGAGLAVLGAAAGGIAGLGPIIAALGPPLLIAGAVLVAIGGTIAMVKTFMDFFGVSVRDVVRALGDFINRARDARPALERLVPGFSLLMDWSRGATMAIGVTTAYMSMMSTAATAAAAANYELADSFNEINAATEDVATQMARTSQAAFEKRQRLRDEFLSPEERGARKEKELFDAKAQVNKNRVLGFISEEQAAWEQKQLDIAIQRHRLAEADRRARAAELGKPLEKIKIPPLAAMGAAIEERAAALPSVVTFSGAGLLAGGQSGGVGIREMAKDLREHLKEAREMRKTLGRIERKEGPKAV